jgi:hypothetical protein
MESFLVSSFEACTRNSKVLLRRPAVSPQIAVRLLRSESVHARPKNAGSGGWESADAKRRSLHAMLTVCRNVARIRDRTQVSRFG